MPTFTSPVALTDFQTYLKDASTDTTVTGFFQTCLNAATEAVYTWLDRDYTASASKTDVFWGDDTAFHSLRHQAGSVTAWSYTDLSGTVTTPGTSDLLIRANGYLLQTLQHKFQCEAEHTVIYHQPSTLTYPETVMQVITEVAALLYQASNQGTGELGVLLATHRDGTSTDHQRFLDLTEFHKDKLRPYKRYPV
jgi:hypothetical protein